MAPNRLRPHVYVLPEDDAFRQIAIGFEKDHRIKPRAIQTVPVAGGYSKAVDKLTVEYFPILQRNSLSHVVVLIDCDENKDRIPKILEAIPNQIRDRVFVLGILDEVETLAAQLKLSKEQIGEQAVNSCFDHKLAFWSHDQLSHNLTEVSRLRDRLRPEIFES